MEGDFPVRISTPAMEDTLGRRKKLVNNSGIPQHAIETIARVLYPDILAFFESEEGQREYAAWKAERQAKEQAKQEER